jgi:hypothetical protein
MQVVVELERQTQQILAELAEAELERVQLALMRLLEQLILAAVVVVATIMAALHTTQVQQVVLELSYFLIQTPTLI